MDLVRRKRTTFRHGNLPEALVAAALKRLEREGADALSLRELARDAGVNHRAVYRHFPDKLSLLARVGEEVYRRFADDLRKEGIDDKRGEVALVASGVAFFRFARNNPNLIDLIAGPRINMSGAFPALEAAITEALTPIKRGFIDIGTDSAIAMLRAILFLTALQGITAQILYGRIRVAPKNAPDFVANISRMLIKGLR